MMFIIAGNFLLFNRAPIVSVTIRIVSKRFRKISKNMQTGMGHVTASAEQMLKAIKKF